MLLAVEAAALPDQRVLTQSHIIDNAGPLTNKVGGSGIGRRTWTRTGTGRMLSTYRATMAIERAPVDVGTLSHSPLPSLPEDVLPFIWPSRYCEADRFVSFVCGHFPDLDGGALVQALVDWVRDNVAYVPGSSNITTTAADTFVAQQGVCRDFAHLTAALIRSRARGTILPRGRPASLPVVWFATWTSSRGTHMADAPERCAEAAWRDRAPTEADEQLRYFRS